MAINPFLAIAAVTEDEEYKKIFEDMSRGIFPQGFKFERNKLTYHSGKRVTPIQLSEDPEEARNKFLKVINRKGLKSSCEITAKREKIIASHERGWGALKNAAIQTESINNFVDRVVREKHLTRWQDKQLRELLFMAHYCDILSAEGVEYTHEGISKIHGLQWDPVLRRHTLSHFDFSAPLGSRK